MDDMRVGDTTLAHVEAFPYEPHDDTVNQPLIRHMRDYHRELFERWDKGNTIGDIEDQHYIAHGLLTSETELIADIKRDNSKRR